MPDLSLATLIAIEIALALLVLCGFLMIHARRLHGLVRALEGKIAELRGKVKANRGELRSLKAELASQQGQESQSWTELLDAAIAGTRAHHSALNPDRDIVLDITPDAPLERRAASLRHAFLIAEQEAWQAGDEEQADWTVLAAKLSQLIDFMAETNAGGNGGDADAETDEERAALADELANAKRRVENLERFKRLCFDMEAKWQEATRQATDYEKQLQAMGRDLGAGDEFERLLAEYSDVYQDIGDILEDIDGNGAAAEREGKNEEERSENASVGKIVIANQGEIQRLRNMAVDQHKVIVGLKQRLVDADSAEKKGEVIADLSKQLERHERFVKEADQCTRLLEDELSRTLRENLELQEQLKSHPAGNGEELQTLEQLVSEFAVESKNMLQAIATLEQENQALKLQLNDGAAGGEDSAGEAAELKQRLAQVQQELLNLQTQHIELEERYLELKTQ